jgi:small subunit ribosomal protein S8
MSVADFIADQLTVIRNAIMSGKKTVIIKKSSMMEGIIRIIKNEGFIQDYQVIEDNKQGRMKIYLKLDKNGTPVMENLEKISTPGRRVYLAAEDVPKVMGGVGISIMSTDKGLLSDKDAREKKVGGEIICKVW